jgi:predicted acetyltransferase
MPDRTFKVAPGEIFSDGVIDLIVVFCDDGRGEHGTVPFYACRMCLGGTDIRIGTISLRLNAADNLEFFYDGNLGYIIREEFRGKGFAVRACLLASRIATLEGMNELIINCNDQNASSIRVIEKLGAEFIETIVVPDEYLDEHDASSKRRSYLWKLPKN